MDISIRISEIEKALRLLGLELCSYCNGWDKKENFIDIRMDFVDGAWITNRFCTDCQKVIIKNRSK